METQEQVNDCHWCFPESFAVESAIRTVEAAPGAEAILVNGMCNFRRDDNGLAERVLHKVEAMEAATGLPVLASDITLYWALFRTLGVAPAEAPGRLLSGLAAEVAA